MKPICFYHRADLDGVCSGAIVKMFVPDCELFGIDYADIFPWGKVENLYENDPAFTAPVKRTVYMVDFCLTPDEMRRLASVSHLTVIDHHKTFQGEYDGPEGGCTWGPHTAVVVVGMAGCELCWHYFNGTPLPWEKDRGIPEAIRLLGRYDVWDKDNPDWGSKILPFQYGMRAQPGVYNPEALCWDCVITRPEGLSPKGPTNVELITMTGHAILDFQAGQNAAACRDCAYEARLVIEKDPPPKIPGVVWSKTSMNLETGKFEEPPADKYRLICLNTPNRGSQNFDSVWDPEKHDIMAAYVTQKDGRIRVSFYSDKPEIDCGTIAKTFGGGGHRGAAGFICDQVPWERK